jgi:hypothetical protein
MLQPIMPQMSQGDVSNSQEPVAADSFGSPGREDSDAWLANSGAELEAELQRAARAGAGASSGSAQAAGGADGSGAADTRGPEAQLDQMSKRLQVSDFCITIAIISWHMQA